jgi:hypothetical protein
MGARGFVKFRRMQAKSFFQTKKRLLPEAGKQPFDSMMLSHS